MDNFLNLAKQFIQNIFSRASQAPVKAQTVSPISSPTPTPQPIPETTPKTNAISADQVKQGFLKYDANAPLATQSGVIAQALSSLSPSINPKLILAKIIAETRAGKDLIGRQEGLNNPLNTMYKGKLINYPDLKTALTGGPNPLEGHNSQGIINILNGPLYQKFRQSGNLADFFNTYSNPSVGNPPTQDQIQKALEYMKYWQ